MSMYIWHGVIKKPFILHIVVWVFILFVLVQLLKHKNRGCEGNFRIKLNFGKRTSSLVCAVILNVGRDLVQAVIRQPLMAEVRIQSLSNSYGVCSGKFDPGTGLCPSI